MKRNPRYSQTGACIRVGFTLVELLVVVLIIAALAAVSFSMTTRIKRSADLTKNLQNIRQVGLVVATTTSENAGNLPPIRTDVQDASGNWKAGQDWPWIVLFATYPDIPQETLRKTAWWKANKPFMYNSGIVNNMNSGKFNVPKTGIGMNQVIAGQIFNYEGGWVPGANGYQTRPVPLSKIPRPSRTLLFAPSLDYHFKAANTKEPAYKGLITDGKIPAYFVDGHAETILTKQYTKANYDFSE